MRLLQRQADGKYSLIEVSQNIPRYAILSHTWEEGEEVTFEDVTQNRRLDKKGYQKLQFCARQAVDDNIQYFWVDSCCIDKSSSAELSEAINSMFRWYQQSTKCYAYFADVSKPTDAETDELSRPTWEPSFRQSRWFTRGWTLQELLAPASVEFFSREGQRLGDKRSLEQLLIDITNIPEPALRGSPLAQFSIDERMSWVEGRTTTREEDKAYSLFGIFGVFLPLIYGEGAQHAISRLLEKISTIQNLQAKVLAKLPIAQGAAFDSHAEEHNPTCLQDTRVELLHEIDQWIKEPNTKSIFWLNGMAGTGKSTISRTLAKSASKAGFLGATFFFKRGEGDRGGVSKFFSTLAAQLCSREPSVLPHIQAAIDSDPSIFGKAMREQFNTIILQPLSKILRNAYKNHALLVVVDALDECEHEEDVKRLIHLFSSSKPMRSPRLKIFLTSRPELPIRLGFTAIKGSYQDLVLHEVAEPIIERDIRAFLESELTRVRMEYNASVPDNRHVPTTWPRGADIQTLVEMAVPLFIFAATVCRFVRDRKGGNPQKKLGKVLEQKTKSQESKLNAAYLPVLEQLLIDQSALERKEVLERFHTLVGSIVILASPLSASALARLLQATLDDILDNLDLLHSVLSIPSSSEQPIRLLHTSFRDFLLDPEKRENNPFWIDENEVHRRLAAECLRVMNGSLKMDICEVQAPGTALSEIDHRRISEHLPPEIQYACRYWVYHLEHSGAKIIDDDEVHRFLTSHFLHWLESLSLMDRLSESLEILASLTKITSSTAEELEEFFNDANRFILATVAVVQLCPLQIYSSALLFSPKKSVIRTLYDHVIPRWISRYPVVNDRWNSCRQTLEGHRALVTTLAFSRDGQVIASASSDKTIKLWDVATGAERRTLRGHKDWVSSLAFSPDGLFMASTSYDNTIKLWDMKRCSEWQTLVGHSGQVTSVIFSPDSRIVVSESVNSTVHLWNTNVYEVNLWDVATGKKRQTLTGHTDFITSVAFSLDGQVVALASYDHTVDIWDPSLSEVNLWDVTTGKKLQKLAGYTGWVRFLAFSPDGQALASVSASVSAPDSTDGGVRIWDITTGSERQNFALYAMIQSLIFSPDGQMISLISDKEVNIWEIATGSKLKMHSNFGLTQSAILWQYASITTPWTFDLTQSDTFTTYSNFKRISSFGLTQMVAFSPNCRFIATTYKDVIQLWDLATATMCQTLTGHSSSITSVAFSPNGKVIASAADDKTIKLWDATALQKQQRAPGHSRSISLMVFSPDGQILASASEDETVKLWDTRMGEERQTAPIGITTWTVSFSPDCTSVLTDMGPFPISSQLPKYSPQLQSEVKQLGYGISKDRSWITWRGKHLLWLPPDFRPTFCGFAVFGSLVAIGCASGKVVFIQCDVEGIGKL